MKDAGEVREGWRKSPVVLTDGEGGGEGESKACLRQESG